MTTLLAMNELLLSILLAISPAHAIGPWAEFTYTMRINAPAGTVLCWGWRYPQPAVYEDEQPQATSCRFLDRDGAQVRQERWGGSRWPLLFVGFYVAFADLFHPQTGKRARAIEHPFQQLEGLPRQ